MAVQKTDLQLRVIQRVKDLRGGKEESQQQLAIILGTTNGHIGNIESLKYTHKYTLPQLNTLARHYGVPIETFFMTEGERELTIAEYTNRLCEYLEG